MIISIPAIIVQALNIVLERKCSTLFFLIMNVMVILVSFTFLYKSFNISLSFTSIYFAWNWVLLANIALNLAHRCSIFCVLSLLATIRCRIRNGANLTEESVYYYTSVKIFCEQSPSLAYTTFQSASDY